MDRAAYLSLLEADGQLLLTAAQEQLDRPVPPCPGWVVRDVVQHTAEVYEHKITCIELRGERPEPWPPPWPDDRDPLEWFADAHRRMVETLQSIDPDAPSWTWWPPDQRAGFWVRRMAQETAIHRVDVQSAAGAIGPVAADLAVDGIDEVLAMMLAGDWSDEPQPGSTGTIAVDAGGQRWWVELAVEQVTVEQVIVEQLTTEQVTAEGRNADRAAREPDARVSGDPSDVLLWLWGRAGDAAVTITGDPAAAQRLRARLAVATQ